MNAHGRGWLAGCRLGAVTALGLAVLSGLPGCVTRTVVVSAPPVAAEPVVVEESVGFEAPVGVEFYYVNGRYAYWHPRYHRWYYRPSGWHPPRDYHPREMRSTRELERIHPSPHQPNARREAPRRREEQEQRR